MRIIVVEDERVTRDGLAGHLNGMDDVEVVAKCVDARDGYEKIMEYRPDVVITDIVMGDISGLDMIERCRKDGVTCEFVLLSGYSEFEYARRGLQLNVFDYLNKPLNFSSMENIIARLKSRIHSERKHSADEAEERKSGEAANPLNSGDFFGGAELYVVASNFYSMENGEGNVEFGRDCCKQIEQRALKGYTRYMEKRGMHCQMLANREEMNAYTGAMLSYVKSHRYNFGMDVRIGISASFEDISDVSTAIDQAIAAEQDCAFNGKNIEKASMLPYSIMSSPDALFSREFELIREKLKQYDAEALQAVAFEGLENIKSILPPYAQFAFLIRCIQEIAWNVSEDKTNYVPNETGNLINSAPSEEMMKKRFSDVVCRIIESERPKEKVKGDSLDKAIQYMKLHYNEPLQGKKVAQMFYMDSAYFSRKFKERMGTNYNAYITQLRMRRAEQLLKLGGMSVAEVAREVGYRSHRHFSVLFREYFGVYPSDIIKK